MTFIPVLQNRLKNFQGEEIVVVMADNRAFRGRLVEFDDDCIVLNDVVEALPDNAGGWEEPTVSTSVRHKVITWRGTLSHDSDEAEIVRLKDVVIRLAGVLRIWEWSAKNLTKPEHVEMGESQHTHSRVSGKL